MSATSLRLGCLWQEPHRLKGAFKDYQAAQLLRQHYRQPPWIDADDDCRGARLRHPPATGSDWLENDPGAWAAESYSLAKSRAYIATMLNSAGMVANSASYATTATGVAQRRLQLVGVRLAPKFFAVALFALALNQTFVVAIVGWLRRRYELGLAVVFVIVPASTYLLARFWAFGALRPA